MLIGLAKMAKVHTFGLANSLLDSPMATWPTLTGTLTMSWECNLADCTKWMSAVKQHLKTEEDVISATKTVKSRICLFSHNRRCYIQARN